MSQQQVKDVRSGGKIIGQTTVTTYDDLDEMSESIGEERILALCNRQLTIDALDTKRRELTGTGGTGIRALSKKAKENPELEAKIKALLAEYGG